MHRSDAQGGGAAGRRTAILAVAALTLLGLLLRLLVARQSVSADELATDWVVSAHGFGGVISVVHSNAEITPPLFFVLAWLTTRIGHTADLLRAPSLIAGTATIPVVYLIGLRSVGRRAALVAAALIAFSPFMIFYATEARGYGLMMFLVALSTLALLRAVHDGGRRWWVLYAACSCGAVYTHYTSVFALAGQLAWLFVAHPEARRPALLANAGAVAGFAPWITGFLNDVHSPTTKILSALEPFNFHAARQSLEHVAVGYPFIFPTTGLRAIPGDVALVLLAVAVGLAAAAVIRAATRRRRLRVSRPGAGVALVVMVALSVPVGEALASFFGTHLFGARNLAPAWPAFALSLAALLFAGRRTRLGVAAAVLAVASYGIGAVKMLDPNFQRLDYDSAARFIDRAAAPGDVVIDRAVVSPGPYTGLERSLKRPRRVFRTGKPQERDHPFNVYDPVVPIAEVNRSAFAAAQAGRVFVLSLLNPPSPGPPASTLNVSIPARFRPVETHRYPGIVTLLVTVYAAPPG